MHLTCKWWGSSERKWRLSPWWESQEKLVGWVIEFALSNQEQQDGKDGGDGDGEREPKIGNREELIPGSSSVHTQPRKTRVKGPNQEVASGHIFTGLVMCHLGERFWCYFYSLQNVLLLNSLLRIWKYSPVLDPGPSRLVAVLKALGNALVPCVVPPPYLHWGFALSWAILSPPQFELIWSSNPFLLGHKARMQPPMQSGVATTEF